MAPAPSYREIAEDTRKAVFEVLRRQDVMDTTLTRNTLDLEKHIKRTELLEKRMDEKDRRDAMWDGAFKLIVILGAAAGAVTSVIGLWKLFH